MSHTRANLRGGESLRERILPALALALFVGVLAYCLMGLVVGPSGLIAYSTLSKRVQDMLGNLENLSETNAALQDELDSLRGDPDRIAREARELGYLRPGETEVVLAAAAGAQGLNDAGSVLPLRLPEAVPDSVMKATALGACLAVLALRLARRRQG
jgi:cell division protein FtsB